MNGNELLKKLKRLARERNLTLAVETHKGKGSHVVLWLGGRRTTLKDRKKEIGAGLLDAMLQQLGLSKGDLQ